MNIALRLKSALIRRSRNLLKKAVVKKEQPAPGLVPADKIPQMIKAQTGQLPVIEQLVAASGGELQLFENVISFPVTDTASGYGYYGGLVDPSSLQLIEEAILLRNDKLCQQLPDKMRNQLKQHKHQRVEATIFYGGILINNYGHFLVESLGRLWAYAKCKQFDPYILFYTSWGMPAYWKKDHYMNLALKAFGIPVDKVIIFPDIVELKTVIVPAQKYGFGIFTHPDPVFMKFIRSFSLPANMPKGIDRADKIYVSRSRMPFHLGKLIGESRFEKFLEREGYLIFHPQDHTLYEQLNVYRQAKKIIFCDGSAVHTCILTPDLEASVAIIARRRDSRWNYQEITGQFMGYKKPVLWVDEVLWQYRFGVESWDAVAEVDWYKVSLDLKKEGYLNGVYEEYLQPDYNRYRRSEFEAFVRSMANVAAFVNYLEKQKEITPLLPLGYGGLEPGYNLFNALQEPGSEPGLVSGH